MHGIVLTFDRQIPFALLVVESYRALWPAAPFTFRVPYNAAPPPALLDRPGIELVRTDPDIRSTMAALLSGIGEEEFVYWAIDDRYPYWIRDARLLERIAALVASAPGDLDGVKLTNHAIRAVGGGTTTVGGEPFHLQADFPGGFYLHHFVRCGVLRRRFLDPGLPDGYTIVQFHERLCAADWKERILVPERPLVHFGETCTRGKMTENCRQALTHYGLDLPEVERVDLGIVYDDSGRRVLRGGERPASA